MFIKFTDQELKHIEGIKNEYSPKLLELQAKIDKQKGEKRQTLIHKHSVLWAECRERLEKYLDDIQRERFKSIKEQGTAAILEHATEQAPLILEQIHKDTIQDYGDAKPQVLKDAKIGTYKRGKLYINANMATDWLKDELQLHLEALQGNKEAIQDLLEIIIEAVENSPYTDSEEIIEQATPANIMRYRRSPLMDISVYGLMNDKANTRMLQDADIFTQEADGQMKVQWAINQAPAGEEQVPVYVSLTMETTDTHLSKKLTAYDSAVYNAIADIFYYWKRENPLKPLYVTPAEIWRRMNGKQSRDGSAKPSAAQINRINRSINKMRHIDFLMDIKAEINAHYITLDDERISGYYLKDYLLNCSEVGFYTEKGRQAAGYRINTEPVLYTYNAAKDHILFLPFNLLDTSKSLSDGENVTEFKTYLLQQILLMKNGVRDNRRILLNTIYEATGILTPEERIESKEYKNDASRQKEIRRFRKADRDKIEGILTAWIDKKWIKGFTVLNQNNKPIREKQQAKGYEISI